MECKYYQKLGDGSLVCQLCPHHCHIANGRSGICRSRSNHSGTLISEAYGRPCALAIDPIEKKPLYHFHPGTKCLSIAAAGCNLHCQGCQNHEISQRAPADLPHHDLTPEAVVELCIERHLPGIAYTYTEPLTYLEYTAGTARLAHEAGLWNILVTAGYVCQEPLKDLLPHLDAANIDLKFFDDKLYQRISGGRLQPVLDTILAMKDEGIWIEITNLLIPGTNDDMDLIRSMCRWLVANGLANAPLHFSRFFPRYKLSNVPITPAATMQQAKIIAVEEGIEHVYLGNI